MKVIKKILIILILYLFIFLVGCIDKPNLYYPEENFDKYTHIGITNCKKYYREDMVKSIISLERTITESTILRHNHLQDY